MTQKLRRKRYSSCEGSAPEYLAERGEYEICAVALGKISAHILYATAKVKCTPAVRSY